MSDDLQTARREMEQLRYPEALWSILTYLEAQQQASADPLPESAHEHDFKWKRAQWFCDCGALHFDGKTYILEAPHER